MLAAHYSAKAKAFLKTVVCFDDELVDSAAHKISDVHIAKRDDSGFDDDSPISIPEIAGRPVEIPAEPHPLDFRATANAFAEGGILCSVLKPEKSGHDLVDQIASLANCADVTLLDWQLEGRAGGSKVCRDAIKKIFEKDQAVGGRLRLIVIFTGTDGKAAVDQLLEELTAFGASPVENEFALKGSHWRVVVFQKPDTFKPTAEKIGYLDLPDRIVKEFSKLTDGLMPTAVLHGITAIRENTHRLLAIFDRELDVPFLAHRALIPDPNDAGEFFLDVFQDELGALMRNCGIKECVGGKKSSEWVTHVAGITEAQRASLSKAVLDSSDNKIEDFSKSFEQKGQSRKKIADKVLQAIGGNSDASKAKERLAQLVSLYGAYIPPSVDEQRMQLGVLVHDEQNKRYLMCLQPLCDSVRVTERTWYPFLILDEVIEEKKSKNDPTSRDLFVQINQKNGVWLQTTLTPKKLVSFAYDPSRENGSPVWKPKIKDGVSVFEAMVGENVLNLSWIGEVKLGKAQRISSGIASRFHTLGIDEFEWQRLHQK